MLKWFQYMCLSRAFSDFTSSSTWGTSPTSMCSNCFFSLDSSSFSSSGGISCRLQGIKGARAALIRLSCNATSVEIQEKQPFGPLPLLKHGPSGFSCDPWLPGHSPPQSFWAPGQRLPGPRTPRPRAGSSPKSTVMTSGHCWTHIPQMIKNQK